MYLRVWIFFKIIIPEELTNTKQLTNWLIILDRWINNKVADNCRVLIYNSITHIDSTHSLIFLPNTVSKTNNQHPKSGTVSRSYWWGKNSLRTGNLIEAILGVCKLRQTPLWVKGLCVCMCVRSYTICDNRTRQLPHPSVQCVSMGSFRVTV